MKILLVHASAGAGHFKAAEAIFDGVKKHTSHQATLIDGLNYSNPLFEQSYRKGYFFMISKVPLLWGIVFGFLDLPMIQPLMRIGRRIYNKLNTGKLHRYLKEEQFDVIISTHFMSTEVACALKRKGVIKSKVITVVTDYEAHRIWLSRGGDVFAVASDWTKKQVMSCGVGEDKIVVTGIPTNEKFSEEKDIAALKEKIGVKPDMFTVLMATGSFGIGPIEAIIEACAGFQIVVVCGHNKNLFEKLSAQKKQGLIVCGLVDNMHELMAVSDVMVTKPGGLSVSEALVSKLPMIFFSAIPGQETNNVKVLKEYGIGFKSSNINDIVGELKRLESSKEEFEQAVLSTQKLARPNAVADIISLIEGAGSFDPSS